MVYLLCNELWNYTPAALNGVVDILAAYAPCFVMFYAIFYLRSVIRKVDQKKES